MQIVNFNNIMKKQIQQLSGRPRLLLHSCCAPCSCAVLEKLNNYFEITIYYFNPNIYPTEEFIKRSNEQKRLINLQKSKINIVVAEYNESVFLNKIKGKEEEKEGGARCALCFELRLKQTAIFAKENNYDFFGTTLTISPHKNANIINALGEKLSKEYNVNFLHSDFKKENGYKRSIDLSLQYSLYRQNYCGCRFSLSNKGENEI